MMMKDCNCCKMIRLFFVGEKDESIRYEAFRQWENFMKTISQLNQNDDASNCIELISEDDGA